MTITNADVIASIILVAAMLLVWLAVYKIADLVYLRRDRKADARIAAARQRVLDAAETPDAEPDSIEAYIAKREREHQADTARWIAERAAELRREREKTYRREWAEMREDA